MGKWTVGKPELGNARLDPNWELFQTLQRMDDTERDWAIAFIKGLINKPNRHPYYHQLPSPEIMTFDEIEFDINGSRRVAKGKVTVIY